jgi:hypothetical protein
MKKDFFKQKYEDDNERARTMLISGASIEEIAAALGLTKSATQARLRKGARCLHVKKEVFLGEVIGARVLSDLCAQYDCTIHDIHATMKELLGFDNARDVYRWAIANDRGHELHKDIFWRRKTELVTPHK